MGSGQWSSQLSDGIWAWVRGAAGPHIGARPVCRCKGGHVPFFVATVAPCHSNLLVPLLLAAILLQPKCL